MAVELVQLPEAVVATTVPDAPLDPFLQEQVDGHWAKALIERPGLVDGQLFSVYEMSARGFTGRFVPYRRLVASLADGELAAKLEVAPLAITGRTVSSDGCAVLGTRTPASLQEPGRLEFVPSGGVDEQARVGADHVDPTLTVYEELREELGVDRTFVVALVPRVVAIDEAVHVHDLVFDVHLDLTAAEISGRHRASTANEHDPLEFVPLHALEASLSSSALGAVTQAILALPFTMLETP
jgi:hypothetical protein